MLTTALMAFLHHLLAFTLTACLVYEFIAYRKDMAIAVILLAAPMMARGLGMN